MENFLEKISVVAKKNGVTTKLIIETISMTENGFYTAIRNKTLKISTLEKIAEYLGVPVSYFFEEQEKSVSQYVEQNSGSVVQHNGSGDVKVVRSIGECERECDGLREKLNVAQTQIEELKQDKMFLQNLINKK